MAFVSINTSIRAEVGKFHPGVVFFPWRCKQAEMERAALYCSWTNIYQHLNMVYKHLQDIRFKSKFLTFLRAVNHNLWLCIVLQTFLVLEWPSVRSVFHIGDGGTDLVTGPF